MGHLRTLWQKAKKNAGDSFTKGTGDMLDKYEAKLEKIRKACKDLKTLVPGIESEWMKVLKTINDHIKGLKSAKGDLSGFSTLASGIKGYTNQVGKELGETDKELTAIVKSFGQKLDL